MFDSVRPFFLLAARRRSNGTRSGAYGPIKNILKRVVTDDKRSSVKFLRNVAAGCLSGAIAAIASNPVDLCKTKLQAKNSPYTSSIQVIRDVIKDHGVKGLWVGTVPAAVRTGRRDTFADRHTTRDMSISVRLR